MDRTEAPKIAVDVTQYLADAGLTMTQLSDLTGIPRTTLYKAIDYPGTMTFGQAKRIGDALNIPDEAWSIR